MPKVLDTYEFASAGIGRSTYDWDTLLDGKIYQLTKGEDFDSETQSMGMLIRKNAGKRGLAVRVSRPDENTLVIQVVGPAKVREKQEDTPQPQANGVHKQTQQTQQAPKPQQPQASPTPKRPVGRPPVAKSR